MELQEVVIVSACRTAIGDFMGSLKTVPARDLALAAGKEAIERAGIDPQMIDEICMGQIFTALQGSLPARQVGIRLGLPERSSAVTVNQNCASGMRATEIAAHNIMLGKTDIALLAAVESMTTAPYLLPKGRMGYRMGPGSVEDHMLHDGFVDELVPGHMGATAENIADKYAIGRRECDEYAVLSHLRARRAIEEGRFHREIVPVDVKTSKGTLRFDTDEHVDRDATVEKFGQYRPAFKKNGVVTMANGAGISDGAAAAVMMSKRRAKELGLSPLLKLVNICSAGVAPDLMGLGPGIVIPKCLSQAALTFEDIDYWEINEAFSVQMLGVKKMLKEEIGRDLDLESVNHNGSGISLGHPVGCTGLRLIVTLYYELERLESTLGSASLCVGGGPAMASIWTRDI